jgi:cytochrome c oxidase subunit 3
MEDFTFPKAFIVSTVILLLSSFSISRGVKAFRDDDLKELFISLLATLVLAIAFAVSQYTGWKKLYDAGFYLSTQAGVSFLYIISGLHLLHVMAGILVLAWLCISAGFKLTDDVQGLVYLSNRFEELKLELFTIYWHFVDFLWLCLFFVFLFTF